MRAKRVKQLRKDFQTRYGRKPHKSEWKPAGWVTTAGPQQTPISASPAGFEVTRNEERILRDLYRKSRKP